MGNEFQQEYFEMMATLAVNLSTIQVEIIEQSYNNQAFGSWWFIYKKGGSNYRIVFDGQDQMLRCESQVGSNWETDMEIRNESNDKLISNILLLIQTHSK